MPVVIFSGIPRFWKKLLFSDNLLGVRSKRLEAAFFIDKLCQKVMVKTLLPESCTKYRSEALQAAVDSWCKIQVISQDLTFPGKTKAQIAGS